MDQKIALTRTPTNCHLKDKKFRGQYKKRTQSEHSMDNEHGKSRELAQNEADKLKLGLKFGMTYDKH